MWILWIWFFIVNILLCGPDHFLLCSHFTSSVFHHNEHNSEPLFLFRCFSLSHWIGNFLREQRPYLINPHVFGVCCLNELSTEYLMSSLDIWNHRCPVTLSCLVVSSPLTDLCRHEKALLVIPAVRGPVASYFLFVNFRFSLCVMKSILLALPISLECLEDQMRERVWKCF